MKNAIIIGGGMVGQATMFSLGIGDHISKHSRSVEIGALMDFKYIFICLPTPTINGIQDISLIEEYVKTIASNYKDNRIIIRSTVLPGTCQMLAEKYKVKIAHIPEFLTESTWEQDSKWPDIIVIGANDEELRDEVAGIFVSRFKGAEYFLTDTVTSETIKYAINTLYATKVVFANQVFEFAQKNGANYETIKNACYSRKWIGKNHMRIFNDKGEKGAGGKCLEKDLEAFATATQSPLLKVANELNKKYLHDTKTA